ncbi:MAG: NAD-dependent epimerase/dehydratase family protein [Steroidobacteraceae bacterium]
MRIVVTGATGFIGCQLAQILAGLGHDLVATGRAASGVESARLERLEKSGVRVEVGSLLDPGFAGALTKGCEAVIHLAAAQHEGNVPDSYFRDINVTGTQLLLEAAIGAGARRFVYGSTIGVYGAANGQELTELSVTRPENIYAVTKLEAEQLVKAHSSQIETCIGRISETYGPGDFRLLKLFRAIDRGRFVMLGSGENVRQVIHVDDLAAGLLLAAEHPGAVGETFVFAGTEVMTTNSMVAQIAAALKRRPPRLHVPVWPFRAAAAVLEGALRPLGIQPPLTQRRLDFFTKSFLFSTMKCRQVLGFVPRVSFAEGATATAGWYRKQGYL